MESQRELHLPSHHLPATILGIKQRAGAQVQRDTVLLAYETPVPKREVDAASGLWVTRQVNEFHELRCSGEGQIVDVKVQPGDVVTDKRQPVMVILEPCSHAVQLNGMCAVCGKDMTRVDLSGHADTARATIPAAHNTLGLTVSAAEAQRLDRTDVERLIKSRKLTLVLDLDQTVIHATVDPTVGEWMRDPTNPNNEALKDVHVFTLPHDDNTIYYVKTRPHVQHFLQEARKMYELHIYTMGTRTYADAVAKALDPEGTLFGGRVLSRDESGSFLQKKLERLFPTDQSMAVVVDDRADVWDWSDNLIRVRPYDFFVGIGDINAHVYEAAKRGEIPTIDVPGKAKVTPQASRSAETKPKKSRKAIIMQDEAEAAAEDYDTENGEEPPDEDLNEQVLAELDRAQKQELDELVRSRPLAELAKQLEEEEQDNMVEDSEGSGGVVPMQTSSEESNGAGKMAMLSIDTSSSGSPAESSSTSSQKPASPTSPTHKQILRDDDSDMLHILRVLTEIHTRFYEINDRDTAKTKSSRPVRSERANVADIIPVIKKSVFGSPPPVDIIFSSVIPLNSEPQKTDEYQLAVQYGAKVSTDLHPGITHVVAGKAGTVKVNRAKTIAPGASIVNVDWLRDSVFTFQRQPEQDYQMFENRKPGRLAALKERKLQQAYLSEDESDMEGEGGSGRAVSDLDILHSPADAVHMVFADDDLEEMDREVAEAMGEDGDEDEDDDDDDGEEEEEGDGDELGGLELTEQDREDVGLVEPGSGSGSPGSSKRGREDEPPDWIRAKRSRASFGEDDVEVGGVGDDDDDERLSDNVDYGDFKDQPDDEGDPYAEALERADKEIDINDAHPRRRAKRPRPGKRRNVDEDADLDELDEAGSDSDEDKGGKGGKPLAKKPAAASFSRGKIIEVTDPDEIEEMWAQTVEPSRSGNRGRTAPTTRLADPETPPDNDDEDDWDELAADLDKELAEFEEEGGSAGEEDDE